MSQGTYNLLYLVVQSLLLLVVLWYTKETYGLRKQTERQVEALHKPFLTLLSTARTFEDAVLDMGGIEGDMVVQTPGGNVTVRNVGTGPAVNVNYKFTPLTQGAIVRPEGYFLCVPAGESFGMPVARGILTGNKYHFEAGYESISHRKYKTEVTIENLVLTEMRFTEL